MGRPQRSRRSTLESLAPWICPSSEYNKVKFFQKSSSSSAVRVLCRLYRLCPFILLGVAAACSSPKPEDEQKAQIVAAKKRVGEIPELTWSRLHRDQVRAYLEDPSGAVPVDPWGTQFKIWGPRVLSAGPDQRWETADDLDLNLDQYRWELLSNRAPRRLTEAELEKMRQERSGALESAP